MTQNLTLQIFCHPNSPYSEGLKSTPATFLLCDLWKIYLYSKVISHFLNLACSLLDELNTTRGKITAILITGVLIASLYFVKQ